MTSPTSEDVSIAEEKLTKLVLESSDSSTIRRVESIFEAYESDFNTRELYMLALTFYAENKDKAMYFSHEDKVILDAFKQQITHGKFSLEKSLDFGVLDGVGKDSRLAWENLKDTSKEQAMKSFIILINKLCPHFKTFIEVTKLYLAKEVNLQNEEELQKMKKDKKLKDLDRQKKKEKQRLQIEKSEVSKIKKNGNIDVPLTKLEDDSLIIKDNLNTTNANDDEDDYSEEPQDWPIIVPAEMWTNKNINEFKNIIRKENSDAIIKVNRGETVTVRVPTHKDESCLFWEFATDGYDIGFGVYFEWSKPNTTQVSVRVKESEDEDEDNENYESKDLECGDVTGEPTSGFKPSATPISVIIPVCRRDSHEEVNSGSHQYPGEGVYLLKFSNSYSLWRSKMLYYRVHYTKPGVAKKS